MARVRDIVIHDGSSFALKAALRTTFPGRFTAITPAAVEVHATYSGFADEVRAVQVAPDKDAERPFLPDPATLTDCLLLADRGYPSVAYFAAVRTQGGFFIVRLTRTYDPWVCAAWVEGARTAVPTRIRLSRFLAQHAGQRVDLDVEFADGPPPFEKRGGRFCLQRARWRWQFVRTERRRGRPRGQRPGRCEVRRCEILGRWRQGDIFYVYGRCRDD